MYKQVVDFQGWQGINAAEVAAGQLAGKPREKFVDISGMLKAVTATVEQSPPAL